VSNPAGGPDPLCLLSVGCPHRPVAGRDRMQTLAATDVA
jgi:hypothetical protein